MSSSAHLLLFLWVSCGLATGTDPAGRLPFRSYMSSHGLGNLGVTCMAQDIQGFMWVGTEDGLYRYDGSRFQKFGWAEGLPSLAITTLHLSPTGVLWVGTSEGLARWTRKDFQQVSASKDAPRPLIEWIATGPQGRLWAATERGPVRQEENGHLDAVAGWPGGEASALWAAPQEPSVWVASTDHGPQGPGGKVWEWNGRSWRSWTGASGFGVERIDAFARDRQGRLWARTLNQLWVLGPGAPRFELVGAPLPRCVGRGCIGTDHEGGLWFPSLEGVFHLKDGRWSAIRAQDGLPTSWARVAFEDREGSLWIGSVGVHRLLGRGEWRTFTATEGLPSDAVLAVFRDRDERLWIGSNQGLVLATHMRLETVAGTEPYAIRSIVQGADGLIYAAGNPPEVLCVEPGSRRVTKMPVRLCLAGNRIFRLHFDRQGALWLATEGTGLLRAKRDLAKWAFEALMVPLGTPDETFYDIHEDLQGRLWAAGEEGLALLDAGRWQRFTTLAGLRRNPVASVTSTKDGELLVAYLDPIGVTRARYQEGRLSILGHLDTREGLASDKVYLMGRDAMDRVWIGTGQGVDLVGREGVEHFGLSDGLVGEDCSGGAFLADGSGDVWFGTSTGLMRFGAERHRRPSPPPSMILGAELGGVSLDPSSPSRTGVPRDRESLIVRFAVPSFLNEDAVECRVRMSGLDQEWHTTTAREARYPALAPGQYRFEVQARIGNGDWGPPAAMSFEVLPAWWQTWWFRSLVAIVVAGLTLLVLGWRQRALRERNADLQRMVAARTAELERRSEELARANAALEAMSITDPLTGLNNRRFLDATMRQRVAQVLRTYRQIVAGGWDRALLNVSMTFIMLDIDRFKWVNDEFGHAAGDLVLREVGERLLSASRRSDFLVRWGGEEFLIIGCNTSRSDAAVLVERIRKRMEVHAFDLGDGKKVRRTCSLGFACFPFYPDRPDLLAWEHVVELADWCLLAAKRAGRNGWVGLLPGEPREPAEPGAMEGPVVERIDELIRLGRVKLVSSFAQIEVAHRTVRA